jgi:hypothetical protein
MLGLANDFSLEIANFIEFESPVNAQSYLKAAQTLSDLLKSWSTK